MRGFAGMMGSGFGTVVPYLGTLIELRGGGGCRLLGR